jgi:hypothetical protein
MKEISISNHPLRTGLAVLTAVAACAGSIFTLSNAVFATTEPLTSAVNSTAVVISGTNRLAGLENTDYYLSAKVTFNHIDLEDVQEELAANSKWDPITTVVGGAVTRTPVYDSTNAGARVVCYLAPGTLFTAPQQEESDWYEVYWGDECGFVSAEAVRLGLDEDGIEQLETDAQETYEDSYATLLTDVTLYAQAEEHEDQIICTLNEGETVSLVSGQNGWYAIEYQGTQGYVQGENVAFGADKPTWKVEEEKVALREAVVATAENYLGCPYVYGASGPSRFDCSGFTMYVMAQYGISLPHSAASQFTSYGTSVSKDELQPGDLVFFRAGTTKAASHVGIYIGDGQFVHASSGKGYVVISDLSDSWYAKYYVGAKRVL